MDNSDKQDKGHNRNELRRVQQSLHLMRNRVQLLRCQLQKEKDSITKNKNLTEEMVRRKVEISKITALRNRNLGGFEQEISQLRQRNHSYREFHRKEMDNIFKAVYLVKLDEARQMKSFSQQNRSLLQERQRSLKAQQMSKRRDLAGQSEKAKQRYLEYWKSKLNSIYSAGQRDQMELELENEEHKKQLKQYQQQQIELLQEINRFHQQHTEAKKQYLASLTLSSKQVQQAFQTKEELKKSKSKDKEIASPRSKQKQSLLQKERQWEEKVEKLQESKAQKRYKDHKQRDQDFWSKSPHTSIMSTHDIRMPRANVDNDKLKIILTQLKRLEALDRK